jgi:hypothetical protein
VVGGDADVARLPDVADPGILLLVAAADVAGAVGRCVIRNNEFEVFKRLAEQRLNGFGHVIFTVVDRETDRQPGNSVHIPATSSLIVCAIGAALSVSQGQSAAVSTLIASPQNFRIQVNAGTSQTAPRKEHDPE